jgi:amino acid adenylation domain-containing protein
MSMITESSPIYDREADSARQFWLRALSMDSGEAMLPVNYSKKAPPAGQEPVTLTISGATFDRLTKLTTGSSYLLYVTLLTVAKICLYKYSRSNVISVGVSPLRRDGESSGAAQVLPIVDRIDERMSFRTLLLNTKETMLEAYQYQGYPLRDYAGELGIGEERSFQPQVVLVMKDIYDDITPLRSGIMLKFEMRPTEVSGEVNFDYLLYSPELIRRFINDFQNILGLALEDTATSINNLSSPTTAERRQLISGWNNTNRPFPENLCAHELFVSQASNAPDRVAIIYDDHHLSYLELNRRANQLAHYLKVGGAGPEKCIALCLERSPEVVIGILGVLKAGGVYVPLDPSDPSERLAFMMHDARATILLTEQRLAERLPSTSARVVCMDAEREKINKQGENEPADESIAENLVYVIYTSGSTGEPKGVAVQHRALVARITGLLEAYELTSADRLLQFVSPSFDAFGEEVFTALSCGASLVIDQHAVHYSVHDLFNLVERLAITTLHIPPVYWHQMVDELSSSQRQVPRPLRLFITGGESPSAEKLKKWALLTDNQSGFVNAYGPTEATITSTIYDIQMEPGRTYPRFRVPIGQPVANTEIYILDLCQETAPIGMKGELYIGGAGVARGYFGRAELIAERFVPHPFNEKIGARLYRTGDLGRYLADGNIEFIGRVDKQVKIRGYRIELEEIEAVLGAHRSVKESVVVASEDESGNKRLIGYVVGEEEVTAPSLKKFVRERVPDYMLPEAIILLEEMPITANGKIDRKRLSSMPLQPLLKEVGRQAEQEYLGARTPAEEILVGIFEKVLKLDRIGVRDNFFEIGGHSLLATQVVSQIRNVFGVEMSARSIFEDATVESLARSIEEAMGAGVRDGAPPLVRVDRDGREGGGYPLSFAQQRLWFLDQLAPDSSFYNCPAAVRLEGRLDLEALERVINEIIRRHEALRTRFAVEAGEPIQVIDEWKPRKLEQTDLTNMTSEEKAEEVGRIMREETGRGFDLSQGPLLRVKVLKLEEERHVLLYTMHHIISDGWSAGILNKEVGALYSAYTAGKPSPLSDLPIQYGDFAVWQRAWLQGEVLERQLSYWREQLAGVTPLELPFDFPRPALAEYRGANLNFELSEELTRELQALSRREEATMFMTLLAAFQLLLAHAAPPGQRSGAGRLCSSRFAV